ncbi:Sodium/calcium exchanger protein-domain-containing protein [Xylogone sp. PMI_703]|nr:Sodium/calcium exchanger protein-domain-containing protein [Xylogone sp. PMI_703]
MAKMLSVGVNPRRPVRARYSFRAFYVTVLCITIFTVISLFADQLARYRHGARIGLPERSAAIDLMEVVETDAECRLVHRAKDKCAFVRANCEDEEAGLFSYLSLYYCSLQNAQPVAFIILTLWLSLLFTTIGIAASDFFCINLSTIASILGMSESMAGVTFLAFGNGSPDVFSTFAAMNSNSGSLAVGELIGAAGFITAVVAGSMALVREFRVGKKTFVRDVGFFIIAVSFSMVFLADGALYLWECCVMIGFYLFYVTILVVWHWYFNRRKHNRGADEGARGQYVEIPSDEFEVGGDIDQHEIREGRSRVPVDLPALERNASPGLRVPESHRGDDEDDDEAGVHLAAEMANSMRVARPRGIRRNTITPIRPSLVGALEFRSVLASLQKSQDGQNRYALVRRHSVDPPGQSPPSENGPKPGFSSSVLASPPENTGDQNNTISRGRAVSMGNTPNRQKHLSVSNVANIPDIGVVDATPMFPLHLDIPAASAAVGKAPAQQNDYFSLANSRESSTNRSESRPRSENMLFPPDEGFPGARHLRVDFLKGRERAPSDSSNESPKSRASRLSPLHIPTRSRESSIARSVSPISDFPAYTESPMPMSATASSVPSLILPEPDMTTDSIYQSTAVNTEEKPISWWPYHLCPSPYTILATLFPTLCGWREKTVWDKFVSVISAPSILLLSLTLPVVESDSNDETAEEISPPIDPRQSIEPLRRPTAPVLIPDSPISLQGPETEWSRYRRSASYDSRGRSSTDSRRGFSGHNTAAIAVAAEDQHNHIYHSRDGAISPSKDTIDDTESDAQKDWNRWLVGIQIFTGPLFVMLIIWANGERELWFLAQLIAYSLVGSSIALAILLYTTTSYRAPKYHFLLCFVGFVVSIAWISTIANEVVGVLKSFGVILGISDAILGLTIFAVGNSLGDLVADITVARLGYPVMALSACFGGPMLNILLGIGISGLYMTMTEAKHKHRKHPDKEIDYKPYQVAVSGTLLISAVTLLITLLGLLIAVPLNRWVMSRRIGWGLIALWITSTIVNLAVEISGVWGKDGILV